MPNDDNENPWGGGNNSGNKSPWGNSNGSGGKGPHYYLAHSYLRIETA